MHKISIKTRQVRHGLYAALHIHAYAQNKYGILWYAPRFDSNK